MVEISSLSYFRSVFGDFLQPTNEADMNFDMNFVEAVVNLFMKLQALNLTKFDDLGVKLKNIEPQNWIVWQFDRFCREKCQISKAFGE